MCQPLNSHLFIYFIQHLLSTYYVLVSVGWVRHRLSCQGDYEQITKVIFFFRDNLVSALKEKHKADREMDLQGFHFAPFSLGRKNLLPTYQDTHPPFPGLTHVILVS